VRPPQQAHLDKAPYERNEYGKPNEHSRAGSAKQITELIVESGSNHERNHPPAALVAIVKPLDRGGRVAPREDEGDRNQDELSNQSGLG
jgi:hypothetical protein